MITKLNTPAVLKETFGEDAVARPIENMELANKINEVIDFVNNLTSKVSKDAKKESSNEKDWESQKPVAKTNKANAKGAKSKNK